MVRVGRARVIFVCHLKEGERHVMVKILPGCLAQWFWTRFTGICVAAWAACLTEPATVWFLPGQPV